MSILRSRRGRDGLIVLAGCLVIVFMPQAVWAQNPGTPGAPAQGLTKSVPGGLLHKLRGDYVAQGTNADGGRYEGRVAIALDGQLLRVRWDIGGQIYNGVGVLTGNVLTVDWGQPDPVIYIVNDDGTLSGTWDRGRASERLFPRN